MRQNGAKVPDCRDKTDDKGCKVLQQEHPSYWDIGRDPVGEAIPAHHYWLRPILYAYDAVLDVVESRVQWRSNFQIGSRVLKKCYKPILMHIYGIQCHFMHRSC